MDAEFPDLRSSESIEELEKRQLADVRRQAQAEGTQKRRKPIRYLSPRDTGPPPHIAREIRGE